MAIRPRHVRHRDLERLRHSDRFNSWIAEQATRLGITEADVFELLKEFDYKFVESQEGEEPSIT